MKIAPSLSTIALFWLLSSCSDANKKFRTSSAPVGLKNPVIQQGAPDQEGGHYVTLKPDALEKHFLMTTNYTHHRMPFPRTLASKVIRFKKRGSELFMLESLAGKSYADTVEDTLLARFPIVDETPEGEIIFDFEKGMKLFFFQYGFYLKDLSSGTEPSFSISQSYVESVQLKESHILINHSVRFIQDGVSGSEPLLIRYSLSGYNPDPNFTPSNLNEAFQSKVGYFQSNPVLAPSQSSHYAPIIKYNASKFPITYYLSSNIPPPLVQPIMDGILYWNHVSGEEIFKTAMLPDTIDPNDPGNHIVHWLENIESLNNLGGIADVTSDPLTGEILASRTYIPAHITTIYMQSVAQYLASNDPFDLDSAIKKPETSSLNPVPEFLERLQSHRQTHRCQTMTNISQTHLQQLKRHLYMAKKNSQMTMNPYMIQQIAFLIAKDSLRKSIAHEIGHTLGLRHNFAASTQTDLNNENYDEVLQNYVKRGQLPENFTLASSVMDYFPFLMDSMVGAHIRHKRPPMNYDKDSIRHLYFSDGNPLLFSSPYCSEDHFDPNDGRSYYQDCNQFDTFSNPTAWYHRQMLQTIELLPSHIIGGYQQIQQLLATSKNKKMDPLEFLQKYPLTTPKQDAIRLSQLFYQLSNSISKQAQFIQIQHKYFGISGLNSDDYFEQTREFVNQNIAEFGNVSKLLLSHLAPSREDGLASLKFTSAMEQKLETLFDEHLTTVPEPPALKPSTAPFPNAEVDDDADTVISENVDDDADTVISENSQETDEKIANLEKVPEFIDQQLKKYLHIFEKELLLRNIQVLKSQQFAVTDESFAENLSSFVTRILFDKSPQLLDTFDGVDFYSPQFEYTNQPFSAEDLRKEALSLLTHNFYPESPYYKKEIEEISKNIFKMHLSEVKNLITHENELPNKLYNWIFFEKQRFDQLQLNAKELMDDATAEKIHPDTEVDDDADTVIPTTPSQSAEVDDDADTVIIPAAPTVHGGGSPDYLLL